MLSIAKSETNKEPFINQAESELRRIVAEKNAEIEKLSAQNRELREIITHRAGIRETAPIAAKLAKI